MAPFPYLLWCLSTGILVVILLYKVLSYGMRRKGYPAGKKKTLADSSLRSPPKTEKSPLPADARSDEEDISQKKDVNYPGKTPRTDGQCGQCGQWLHCRCSRSPPYIGHMCSNCKTRAKGKGNAVELLEFTGEFLDLQGLSKCTTEDPGLTLNEAFESKKIKDAGISLFLPEKGGSYDVFNKRPLDPAIQSYSVADVLVMPKLLNTYASKLQSRLASQVHSATLSRIRLSQSPNFDCRGQYMARGPTINRNKSSSLPPPFPMSLVCSENIVNYCSLDQSLFLGKVKYPVSVDSIGKSTASEKTESADLHQLSTVTQSVGKLNL
ncbi:hypothetical protein CLAIMM_14391 [Cladophialophora immunda]|nr:hypothetical protein CLAIMM_14391 [Cladophialophora immunda]